MISQTADMPSGEPRPPRPPRSLAEPYLALWRMTAAVAWGGLASLVQLCDTKPLRTRWSADLSQTVDRTLRSPEFLEFMAGNLRAMAGVARLKSQLRTR